MALFVLNLMYHHTVILSCLRSCSYPRGFSGLRGVREEERLLKIMQNSLNFNESNDWSC